MEYSTQVSFDIATNCEFSKGIIYMNIPIIVRVITIWDEVLYKLRVYIDVLVTRKMVLSYSSHHIDTHLDVFVEVIKVQRSVSF